MQEKKILEEIKNARADIDDYSDSTGSSLAKNWNNYIGVLE